MHLSWSIGSQWMLNGLVACQWHIWRGGFQFSLDFNLILKQVMEYTVLLLEIVEINHWRIGGNKLAINKPLLKWPLRLPRSNFNLILKYFFIRCQIYIRLAWEGGLWFLIIWYLGCQQKFFQVSIYRKVLTTTWSFVDKIDPCKIAPHATIKIQI